MDHGNVPQTTIGRLPIYLRCLMRAQEMNMPVINSVGIAEMAGSNAAQVRKDLSYLGELGTRGIGYDVESLIAHISRWLGLVTDRRCAIVGFGRLGSALLGYGGFGERGFAVVAVFDDDPGKVGTMANGIAVTATADLESCLHDLLVDIVILTTPAAVAQEVAERAVAGGVKAILNFAPVRLELPTDVAVRQVDLSTELQILSFHLAAVRKKDDAELR
jgi:redox-sensing transcriptional repressor